jgi:hypothetical protein
MNGRISAGGEQQNGSVDLQNGTHSSEQAPSSNGHSSRSTSSTSRFGFGVGHATRKLGELPRVINAAEAWEEWLGERAAEEDEKWVANATVSSAKMVTPGAAAQGARASASSTSGREASGTGGREWQPVQKLSRRTAESDRLRDGRRTAESDRLCDGRRTAESDWPARGLRGNAVEPGSKTGGMQPVKEAQEETEKGVHIGDGGSTSLRGRIAIMEGQRQPAVKVRTQVAVGARVELLVKARKGSKHTGVKGTVR